MGCCLHSLCELFSMDRERKCVDKSFCPLRCVISVCRKSESSQLLNCFLIIFYYYFLRQEEAAALSQLQFVMCKFQERVKWFNSSLQEVSQLFQHEYHEIHLLFVDRASLKSFETVNPIHWNDTNIEVGALPLFWTWALCLHAVPCLAQECMEVCVKRFDILPCLPWCHTAIFSLPKEPKKRKKKRAGMGPISISRSSLSSPFN